MRQGPSARMACPSHGFGVGERRKKKAGIATASIPQARVLYRKRRDHGGASTGTVFKSPLWLLNGRESWRSRQIVLPSVSERSTFRQDCSVQTCTTRCRQWPKLSLRDDIAGRYFVAGKVFRYRVWLPQAYCLFRPFPCPAVWPFRSPVCRARIIRQLRERHVQRLVDVGR